MRHDDPEFEASLERFLQGEPDPQDSDLLATTLRQDDAVAPMVRQLLEFDDLLRQQGQPDGDAFVDALVLRIQSTQDDRFVRRMEQVARPAVRRHTLLYVAALAAIAVLSAALLWHWLPSDSQPVIEAPPKVAPGPEARPLIAPMPSSDTMVQIETGQQAYQLPSGVTASVEAPASLRFVDDMFVDLQRGKFSADAGASTKGFTVQTAQARVVDLGTRFGVQAGDVQTEVAVFEGSVRVESRLTATLITLKAGEALRVGEHGDMKRLTGLVATGDRWQDWATQTSSVIASVATTGKTDAFCRLIPRGFKAGAHVYAGTVLRWESAGEMPFPKGLAGADLIQAPSIAARDEDWRMTVTLGRPATLYVFNSKSAPPPKWLADSFVVTGQQVAATELLNPEKGRPARVQMKAVFDVWKRVIRQPSTINLGPPARQKDGKPTAMYGVAAQLLR